jgi:hypothetical protein
MNLRSFDYVQDECPSASLTKGKFDWGIDAAVMIIDYWWLNTGN